MTSSTDTTGHPDVAEISDLTEGLLPPDRSTDVRRHLDTCELCADVYVSVEEIRGLLGSVPGQERMPDDVAQRIDAALAAEAALSAMGEDTMADVSRETSAPVEHTAEHPAARPTDFHADRSLAHTADRPAGRPRTATGPGRKGPEHRRRRGRLVLGAVLTAAVLGAGSLIMTSLVDSGDHTTAHSKPTPSAAAFSGDSLENQVRGLLTTKKSLPQGTEKPQRGPDGESNTPGSTDGPNTLIQTAVPVPDCVRQALGQGDAVLGAKTGTYAGKAAYLVVVADSHDGRHVTAYVIDAACVQQQSASPGKVLLKQSVSRH
ncbi:hypothetical protein JK359_14920 [Streptomyces actinomycinicus]|uniref:Zf-HC2 domain-containing protein n=1 Tax=Streptomyces actinomycinicus TaxID=1695166 RepID=A0A937EJQ8_9ACTN|nr:hypothetical protein [Streptomyces actinomycinicus]MBL1083264.1 hypothetical protein [Streptomyces actinomycinicus]